MGETSRTRKRRVRVINRRFKTRGGKAGWTMGESKYPNLKKTERNSEKKVASTGRNGSDNFLEGLVDEAAERTVALNRALIKIKEKEKHFEELYKAIREKHAESSDEMLLIVSLRDAIYQLKGLITAKDRHYLSDEEFNLKLSERWLYDATLDLASDLLEPGAQSKRRQWDEINVLTKSVKFVVETLPKHLLDINPHDQVKAKSIRDEIEACYQHSSRSEKWKVFGLVLGITLAVAAIVGAAVLIHFFPPASGVIIAGVSGYLSKNSISLAETMYGYLSGKTKLDIKGSVKASLFGERLQAKEKHRAVVDYALSKKRPLGPSSDG